MTKTADYHGEPVIYWKTDANPQRYEQIELFHRWLIKRKHTNGSGRPIVELRLDAANNQSKLIQAVSGVGGDILDASVIEFEPLGVLARISESGSDNYNLKGTYPALKPMLFSRDSQYAYPCNVSVKGLWCNLDMLSKNGVAGPPEEWTPEEFERIGKEYVKRANHGLSRRTYYFCSANRKEFSLPIIRSMGLDVFNESMTACALDDARYVKVLKLIKKWTYEDNLFPSASEVISMNTDAGYGGTSFSQFISGKFAIIYTGRFCLIRFRELSRPINMSLSRIPQYTFQNMLISSRTATLYRGSRNKELSRLFFDFLADKDYNDYIIAKSDGLPPNPRFAIGNPAFLNHPGYANEGNTHRRELEWAMTIALPSPFSPYYKSTGMDWQDYCMDKFMNHLCDAMTAATETCKRINMAIMTTVETNPRLRKQYLLDMELQKRIDAKKAASEKIPVSWIRNPFHYAYYQSTGMLDMSK
jgi:multiple sugar transport system substrate-binding protein